MTATEPRCATEGHRPDDDPDRFDRIKPCRGCGQDLMWLDGDNWVLRNAPTGDHIIDNGLHVYVRFVDGRWVIDSATFDGGALDEWDSGPSNFTCDCGDTEECRQHVKRAGYTDLPTGVELLQLMRDYVEEHKPTH
ncbi:hypothetical protein [Amycolatopsis thermophila]|uniref:Uncharacterized protein n=1 Tax=Amycolatopsis thermophila TaxID=206084 RepID=A0ABU0EMR6_9PSEU|nr:hypothetical protein [Amycolatopsis thermophila]MDQ0376580.1 hypothetical protein [Amycolatopsis thermophila]